MSLVKYNIDMKNMYLVSANDLEKILKTGEIFQKNKAEKLVYIFKDEVSSHCESDFDKNADIFNIVLLKNRKNDELSDSVAKIERVQEYLNLGLEDDNYDIILMPITNYLKIKKEEIENHSRFEDEVIKNPSINRNFISLISKSKLEDCLKNGSYEEEIDGLAKGKVYLTKRDYIDEDEIKINFESDCNIEVLVLKNRNTKKYSDKPEKINSLLKFEEVDIKDPIYDLEIMPLDIYLKKQSRKNNVKGKKVLARKENPKPTNIDILLNFDYSFSDIIFYAQNRFLVKKENLENVLKYKSIIEEKEYNSKESLKEKVYLSKIELINHEDNSRNVDFKVLVLKNKKTHKLSDSPVKIDKYFKYEECGISDPEYTLEKMDLRKYLHKRKITPTDDKIIENKIISQIKTDELINKTDKKVINEVDKEENKKENIEIKKELENKELENKELENKELEKSKQNKNDKVEFDINKEYRQLSFFATNPGEMFDSISNNPLNNKSVNEVNKSLNKKMTWNEKEKAILGAMHDSNTLYILKEKDIVYFPYTVDEIEYYLRNFPIKYTVREDVIKSEYIGKYSDYEKNTFKTRFYECYFLMRKCEKQSILKSFFISIKVANIDKIKTLYIATCRNEVELKAYYKAVKENKLDTFDLFKVENVIIKRK